MRRQGKHHYDLRSILAVADMPVRDARRRARLAQIVAWVLGIFAVFATATAIWPQEPGDVAIGAVLATTAGAAALAAGLRARNRRRFADAVVLQLAATGGRRAVLEQEDAGRAGSTSVNPSISAIRNAMDGAIRHHAALEPLIAEVEPIEPDLVFVADVVVRGILQTGRNLITYHERHATGEVRASDVLEAAAAERQVFAALDAQRQFLDAAAAAVAETTGPGMTTLDAVVIGDVRAATERLRSLAIGMAEVRKISGTT